MHENWVIYIVSLVAIIFSALSSAALTQASSPIFPSVCNSKPLSAYVYYSQEVGGNIADVEGCHPM